MGAQTLNRRFRRFPARAVISKGPATFAIYGYQRLFLEKMAEIGLGRIVALYYRSSTSYQIR